MTTIPGVRRLRRSIRLLERALSVGAVETGCCGEVTVAQCHALMELEQLGTASIGELASQIELEKSTVSRTADSLVGLRLVRRSSQPGDRRVVSLALTSQGKRVCRRLNASSDRLFQRVLEALPADDLDSILGSVETLARALSATLRPAEAPCQGSCVAPRAPRPRRPSRPRGSGRGALAGARGGDER